MKGIPVFLKNFRKGFSTNSSSTHSVIYRNKGEMLEDMNVMERDYYGRFDTTIAASRKAKIKYVAANIRYSKKLLEVMCAFYPEMEEYRRKIEEDDRLMAEDEYRDESFGMYYRSNLDFEKSEYLEASVDYLRGIIDNEDIVIVGGSDEMDDVYDLERGHKTVPMPYFASDNGFRPRVWKNGNYWYGCDRWTGNRVRFKTDGGDCIPQYPELVDLKITERCQWNCPHCYMAANIKGNDAKIQDLKQIIKDLATGGVYYRRHVEFAIGGGNVLLYPDLEELLNCIDEYGCTANTTINVKDCKTILEDEKTLTLFNKRVRAVGVSVCSVEEKNLVKEFADKYKGNVVIHVIPELIGAEMTNKITDGALYADFLFLGYKELGRGTGHKVKRFTDSELSSLFDGRFRIGIDTSFANTYREWLEKNYETDKTITYIEGEYSMYIDGVTMNAYKSSYQLDKPYTLERVRDKKWYRTDEAFAHIREDNGLPKYKN